MVYGVDFSRELPIMLAMVELKAKKRDVKEDLGKIREAGFMPAVFYGKKSPSTPISVNKVEFLKVWKQAGESSVVSLMGSDTEVDALIHEVFLDPVTGEPKHADFYVFDKDKKIEISIPLEFIGTAPAVKDLGGLLVKVMYEIKIEAFPQNLPHQIEVDISGLKEFGSQIHASDIVLPKGVTLLEQPEEVIVLVDEPKEEVEVEAAAIDLSAIEVEKKGKEKEGAVVEGETAPTE